VPAAATLVSAKPPAQKPMGNLKPSCRSCGRTMEEKGDGTLVCSNGHIRMLAVG
jgi:hypothetical protein